MKTRVRLLSWRTKIDEVNECIAANAASEELVDKPEIVKGTVRVSGPFTMEGVIAVEEGPDRSDGPGPLAGPPSPIGGAPDGELEVFEADDAGDMAVANAEAHLDKVIRLLKAAGVDFPGNRNMKFGRIEPLTGAALVHAEGEWLNGTGEERRVAVSIGPEVGNVAAMQVEDAIRSANRAGYDDVVFAGFGFDAAAQDAIESASHPKLRLHMALIRPDVAMDDLLKTQPGSQLFTVFSAPRVKGSDAPGGRGVRRRGREHGRLRPGEQHALPDRPAAHRGMVPRHGLRRPDLLHLPSVLPRQEQVGPAGQGARRRRRGGAGRIRRARRPREPSLPETVSVGPGTGMAGGGQGHRPPRQRRAAGVDRTPRRLNPAHDAEDVHERTSGASPADSAASPRPPANSPTASTRLPSAGAALQKPCHTVRSSGAGPEIARLAYRTEPAEQSELF